GARGWFRATPSREAGRANDVDGAFASYDTTASALRQQIAAGSAGLRPHTRRALEENLGALHPALEEARRPSAADPHAAAALESHLHEQIRRRLDLLTLAATVVARNAD